MDYIRLAVIGMEVHQAEWNEPMLASARHNVLTLNSRQSGREKKTLGKLLIITYLGVCLILDVFFVIFIYLASL